MVLLSLLTMYSAAYAEKALSVTGEAESLAWGTGSLSARYQQPVISDEDLRTDMSILYTASVTLKTPVEGLSVAGQTGLTERFVAPVGESGWRLQDSSAAVRFAHGLQSLDARLRFAHQGSVWLPTSRYSLNQGLRLAPGLGTSVVWSFRPWLRMRASGFGQYRWYAYAEQAGQSGGMNTQWVTDTRLSLDSQILDSSTWGTLSLGMGVNALLSRRYGSRDTFESRRSDTRLWTQGYGWRTRINYSPRGWLTIGLGVSHGGQLRRNGVINPTLAHRDQTLFVAESTITF